MEDTLKRLENKIDRLDERLDSVDKTLIKNDLNLENHIYRTTLAEQNLEILRSEFKPVQAHVSTVNAVLKIIGLIGVFASIATAILKTIELFK